ncbi:MAG: hypothetical protein PHG08_08700 [Bacilli bacterium]|jgi:septation ring formation regulator EzrA|nr:hypothetical protein [Bacilli bacterium]HHU23674.1 hypothetical protein [Acholeplasmataceae bacterium]
MKKRKERMDMSIDDITDKLDDLELAINEIGDRVEDQSVKLNARLEEITDLLRNILNILRTSL